jgi:nucleoside-diphosphate-sugar epimerase
MLRSLPQLSAIQYVGGHMKGRVLVLGADGFIGGQVAAQLASCPGAVPVVAVPRALASGPGGVEQRIVDVQSSASLSDALADISGVVNALEGDADTLVGCARALAAAAARAAAAPRIVHVSSMSVYGNASGWVDESAPLRADLGPYSAAKVRAEAAAAAYPHTVIIRPSGEFGPRGELWTVRIARLLQAHRLGDLGAAGDGFCNLVHVGDVARTVLGALAEPRAEGAAFNVSTPAPLTWNEFLIKFGAALGAVPVRRITQRRLRLETKLFAPPLKVAEIVSRALKLDASRLAPPIPPSLLRLMSQEIRLDTTRARAQFNLEFKDLDSMIEEAARWFKQAAQR